MRILQRFGLGLALGLLTSVVLSGCSAVDLVKRWVSNGRDNGAVTINWELTSSLEKFGEDEFLDYIEAVQEYEQAAADDIKYESLGGLGGLSDLQVGDEILPSAVEESESAKSVADTGITNIQEAGVDEGDIVKAYGDYLIVLSRGRIFTIQVKDGEQPLLQPVFKGKAYAKGFTNGTWYDELLVYDDTVVVIGYSYAISATQVGVFDFQPDGGISHRTTFFIDSNDYYSSRNYASRLIGSKLVFYMPYYLFVTAQGDRAKAYTFPRVRYWLQENELDEGQPLLAATDIYKPVQNTNDPTLHMIVTCDLSDTANGLDAAAAAEPVPCSAQAVLGPYSRNFYVSPDAVYLWVSDAYALSLGDDNVIVEEVVGEESNIEEEEPVADSVTTNKTSEPELKKIKPEPNAHLYALPLDGSGVGVARVYGSPLDQFSFKEGDDGWLNVMVQETGFGEGGFGPEFSNSSLALLRFPLSELGAEPKVLADSFYRSLPSPIDLYSTLQNRFVGDYFLYGSGNSWYDTGTKEQRVWVVQYKQPEAAAQEVTLKSSVDRIEVLDAAAGEAMVVGTSENDLVFSWLRLTNESPKVVDTYTLTDAAQGETRSHGFFYSAAQGIFGLPVRGATAEGYEQLFENSASVRFIEVANDKLTDLGALASATEANERLLDDQCQFSCVDWYGNARPIFYGDRIFALLGYELVEGQRADNKIIETRRTNFFSEAPAAVTDGD